MQKQRKKAICSRFSKAAATYDEYAFVQKESSARLIATLPAGCRCAEILEIGCGTGNYTSLLAGRFPEARITALDFSCAMVDKARDKCVSATDISFLCEDGEVFLSKNKRSFDLITSNATLQWFDDLSQTLQHVSTSLTPDGLFHASLFGPATLHELGEGLGNVFSEPIILAAEEFADREAIRQNLEKYFVKVNFSEKIYTRHYVSLRDLLSHIKKTGTGGYHRSFPVLTRSRLKRLEQWFAARGGYKVTYQVFFVTAEGIRTGRN
ncbi:MAG: malonyl-ACP O-methyltransferase BioC [Desulfobulbaceae bacterium]|nr:malonyl-ACP O-methyltransferase BioC [Desulfobulbaceae bacterium]